MSRFWMVRAGRGGYLAEDFQRAGCVAIGWEEVGDFTDVETLEEMRRRVKPAYPGMKPAALGNSAAMAFKFRSEMQPGDPVVTYDPARRVYLLGTITGDYEYDPSRVPDYDHIRDVDWRGEVSRDALSTNFEEYPGQHPHPVRARGRGARRARAGHGRGGRGRRGRHLGGGAGRGGGHPTGHRREEPGVPQGPDPGSVTRGSGGAGGRRSAGHGLQGARQRPRPDRGRDVIASPDGLGLQQPRIIAEVKHRRKTPMGSEKIRSFVGALRPSDRGLYVSTGGFTKEAKYEADRAAVPVTLLDLEELASLVVEHYESFDLDGRALLPLVRVYWPAS